MIVKFARMQILKGGIMKNKAFTLAEVLITLGIIGVVAALTLPLLIGNYKKKVIETRLQRFYSVANNALIASQAENESWDFWYFESQDTIINTKQWYDKYLAKYWKTVKVESIDDGYVLAYFPDGSLVMIKSGINYFYYPEAKKFQKEHHTSYKRLQLYGKDIFVFAFYPQDKNNQHYYKKGIQPFISSKAVENEDGSFTWSGENYTLEDLYTDPVYGCRQNNNIGGGALCTQLIFQNGWKIPENYPFKF